MVKGDRQAVIVYKYFKQPDGRFEREPKCVIKLDPASLTCFTTSDNVVHHTAFFSPNFIFIK